MYIVMIFGLLLLATVVLAIVLARSSKNNYGRIKLIFTDIADKYSGEMTDDGTICGMKASFLYNDTNVSLYTTAVQFRKYTNVYSMVLEIKPNGSDREKKVAIPINGELTSSIVIDAIDSQMSGHVLG